MEPYIISAFSALLGAFYSNCSHCCYPITAAPYEQERKAFNDAKRGFSELF